jgi:hypothetical protein
LPKISPVFTPNSSNRQRNNLTRYGFLFFY